MSKNGGARMPLSISQNFLTSRTTIDRLIRITGIGKDDIVLEIGAGKGHITKRLSRVCKTVVAYEIDQKLADKLQPELADNVRLYRKDFLKAILPDHPYKVLSNIPFSKTTEILSKLTSAGNPPEVMWLVMEKGAAKRFCGLPRDNAHSLSLKPFYDTRIVYYFQKNDFHPAPSVEAVLLRLTKNPTPVIPFNQRAAYRAFITRSMKYGVNGSVAPLTKKQISAALRLECLPPVKDNGDILYIQWLCLFRCWMRCSKNQRA